MRNLIWVFMLLVPQFASQLAYSGQDEFNWAVADRLYREGSDGKAPTLESLQGVWKKVAVANNPATNSHRVFKTGVDGDYPEGVKNNDGSVMQIEFVGLAARWNGVKGMGAKLENLGLSNVRQGPNPVVVRGNKYVAFNQYFYGRFKQISLETLAEHSCRVVQKNANTLICAVIPRGKFSKKAQSNLVGKVIVYYGFVREGDAPASDDPDADETQNADDDDDFSDVDDLPDDKEPEPQGKGTPKPSRDTTAVSKPAKSKRP